MTSSELSWVRADDEALIEKLHSRIAVALVKRHCSPFEMGPLVQIGDLCCIVVRNRTLGVRYFGKGLSPLLAYYDLLHNVQDGESMETTINLKGPRYFAPRSGHSSE